MFACGERHVVVKAPFDRAHVGLRDAACLMFNAAFPRVDAMQLDGVPRRQRVDQIAGARAFIRTDFDDPGGSVVRHQLVPHPTGQCVEPGVGQLIGSHRAS